MKIERGSRRISLVGKHVTVKLPRVRLGNIIKKAIRSIKIGRFSRYFPGTEEAEHTFLGALSGFFENRRESRLSSRYADILVPTRFSIFGIINIQDTAKDISEECASKIYMALYAVARRRHKEDAEPIDGISEFVRLAAHTFSNKRNYGIHDGGIKLRDYGGLEVDVLLKTYEKELKRIFEEATRESVNR